MNVINVVEKVVNKPEDTEQPEVVTLAPGPSTAFSRLIHSAWLRVGVIQGLLPRRPSRGTEAEEDQLLEEEEPEDRKHSLALRKLHEDLEFTRGLLASLTTELHHHRTFTCLQRWIADERDEQKKKAEFIALFQGQKWKARHMEKSNKLHGLQRDLQGIRQDTHNLIQDKDTEIARLVEAISDTRRLNPNHLQYERKVAKVQTENLQFHIEREEEGICRDIARVGREIPQEIRVHDALTTYLKEVCARLEARTLQWEQRFAADTKCKEEEVARWEAEVEGKQRSLEEVVGRYEEHWAVVQEYEEQQERERKRREEEELHYRAAARIQAWWRGCLVRRDINSGIKKKNKKTKPGKK